MRRDMIGPRRLQPAKSEDSNPIFVLVNEDSHRMLKSQVMPGVTEGQMNGVLPRSPSTRPGLYLSKATPEPIPTMKAAPVLDPAHQETPIKTHGGGELWTQGPAPKKQTEAKKIDLGTAPTQKALDEEEDEETKKSKDPEHPMKSTHSAKNKIPIEDLPPNRQRLRLAVRKAEEEKPEKEGPAMGKPSFLGVHSIYAKPGESFHGGPAEPIEKVKARLGKHSPSKD